MLNEIRSQAPDRSKGDWAVVALDVAIMAAGSWLIVLLLAALLLGEV